MLAAVLLTATCELGILGKSPQSVSTFADHTDSVNDKYGTVAAVNTLPYGDVRAETVSRTSADKLYVGGMTFGVRFSTDGVMVIGYGNEVPKNANPGFLAGIKPSDTIIAVNGKSIDGITALTDALDNCGGSRLTLLCRRNGKEFSAQLTPYRSSGDGRYKTGLLVRDSGAGIGTVTYIVPGTNAFGGLGHGICDGDTGGLIPIGRGTVSPVTVTGVVRGSAGSPGELRGSLANGKIGSVISNTPCGVFGVFTSLPVSHGELLPIAANGEIKNGDACIVCSIDGGTPQKYSIRITDVDTRATGSKCFCIKVTDEALLKKTGGIIQGMSGSPVIQNGRLIGAVTHVLINDPTSGYGIFIGNMLASMPDILQ